MVFNREGDVTLDSLPKLDLSTGLRNPKEMPEKRKHRILIVDDEPDITTILKKGL